MNVRIAADISALAAVCCAVGYGCFSSISEACAAALFEGGCTRPVPGLSKRVAAFFCLTKGREQKLANMPTSRTGIIHGTLSNPYPATSPKSSGFASLAKPDVCSLAATASIFSRQRNTLPPLIAMISSSL